jgi:N-formylglutamate amidohydrolase
MKLPFVISLPHCSGEIPERMRSGMVLTRTEMVDAVDLGTREIFGCMPAEQLLCAKWSRLVVDLNRAPYQRDAKGPVALVDYYGRSVYKANATPDEKEITRRLSAYYNPYHRQLEKTLAEPHIKGLLDCHSLKGIGPPEAPDAGMKRKDIILGNNGEPDGESNPLRGEWSCAPALLKFMKQIFQTAGFSVSLNVPYAGGFIVTHYGPALAQNGKMALQIEINQDLYVDPETEEIIPEKAADVRSGIFKCFQAIGSAI